MASVCRGTQYFKRYDRQLVLKQAISLEKSLGGAIVERLISGMFLATHSTGESGVIRGTEKVYSSGISRDNESSYHSRGCTFSSKRLCAGEAPKHARSCRRFVSYLAVYLSF